MDEERMIDEEKGLGEEKEEEKFEDGEEEEGNFEGAEEENEEKKEQTRKGHGRMS